MADLPSRGVFLVDVGYFEGGETWLIDRRDGRRLKLASTPVFAPEADRLVAFDADEAYGSGDMEVWERGKTGWRRTWRLVEGLADLGYQVDATRWAGPDVVEITLSCPDFGCRKVGAADGQTWPGKFKRGGGGWTLVTSAPGAEAAFRAAQTHRKPSG